ncbi:uncharacterized protein BJX67DRAFT_356508 [Aspergillus lucknowensis]|uniref:F-box domain-containing protein n=1 Tax=Aspergillus lucknowensis TaxID=176173 RepID=A0ABR4LNE5_9EURO
MGQSRKKTSVKKQRKLPANIEDASDTQLLRLLSNPKDWKSASLERRPLRITPRIRQRTSVSSGFFDRLPLEILDMILLELDYASLARLCQTNTTVERYIKHRPFYKLAVEYCHGALQEMANLDLIRLHSARQVYATLRRPACSTPGCTKLGNMIFLPNCQRTCLHCCWRQPLSSALELGYAKVKYNLSKAKITGNLLCFKLPKRRGLTFVVEADVIELAARLRGEVKPLPCAATVASEDATKPFPFIDPTTGDMDFGRLCRPCNVEFLECALVWNDVEEDPTEEDLAEWERHSVALREPGLRLFGTKQLLQHVRSGECSTAQGFWSAEIEEAYRFSRRYEPFPIQLWSV